MMGIGSAASEVSDAELVRRVLDGERNAFEGLISRHQDRLFRHAMGMTGDGDVAADLVQESFIRGFTKLSSCHDPAAFGSWIFRILRNRSLDYLKNRRRKELPLEKGAYRMESGEDPDRSLSAAEAGRAIERALETLPEAQREAFLMKHFDDRPYEEMAEILDASVSALKMRVKRAREAMQVVLEDREGIEM